MKEEKECEIAAKSFPADGEATLLKPFKINKL